MALFSQDRILVPIDFSEEAFQALEEVIAFAKPAAAVHALHVLKALEPTDPGLVWQAIDDDKRKENVQKAFLEKFSGDRYSGLQFVVLVGDPSSKIIDYAEQESIGLIVMPSHGRTGLSRFFMGSVAERVVRFAHCPVLVLRQ
ncbi:MAG: universal stress protein [Leptolyngbya sp. SIO4C1]|nr:universal stress protein [Leptolyngbya sp. SIO4C1]